MEKIKDMIYRQDAIDAFCLSEKTRKYGGDHSGYDTRMLYEIQEVIEGLPSAQPQRPKGEWIDIGSGQECSECHEIQYGYDNFRYFCAFCGADMRGKQDGQ